MSEEEKEAIEYIKAFQKDLYGASEKNLMAIYIDRVWNYIDKLQKDLENLKEVEREICCEELITKDKYQDILKENAELKEELENACKENDELIKENHKHIDYIADMKKKHEDKIRTKIKELEETTAKELRYDFLMNRDEVKSAFIRILEELLN